MNTEFKKDWVSGPPVLRLLPKEATDTRFTSTQLLELGFTDMGNCWGNSNERYWSIETEIGNICVVSYKQVWLERGIREQALAKIDSPKMLSLFIGMLS